MMKSTDTAVVCVSSIRTQNRHISMYQCICNKNSDDVATNMVIQLDLSIINGIKTNCGDFNDSNPLP